MPAPRSGKPQGLVEHLNAQAQARPVSDIIGLDKYYRSAGYLLQQANTYRASGNEEQLYVVLLRYASLVIETIPKHKDFNGKDPKYVKLKKDLVDKYFAEVESLKAALKLKDIVEPVAQTRNRPADVMRVSTSMLPSVNWGPVPTGTPLLGANGAPVPPPPPAEPRVDDLLDFLSHPQQQQQTAPPRPAAPPGGGSPGTGVSSTGSPASTSLPEVYQPKYSVSYSLSSSSVQDRHQLFGTSRGGPASSSGRYSQAVPRFPTDTGQGLPRYPSLEAHAATPSLNNLSLDEQGLGTAEHTTVTAPPPPHYQQQPDVSWPPQQHMVPHPSAGISLGPQEVQVLSMSPHQPGLPDTCAMHAPQQQALVPVPPPPPPQSTPAAPPDLGGPREVTKRAQLRDVHISVALMEEFLRYAAANTSRNIESCGILAGKLSANDSLFTITTLIIPKQEGTTDTVQALNEEEIFDVQFQRELYPMGWIHTHPSQTCFLSSVDVHTQCGYQTMLEEAMAIVMAPRDSSKKCGLFRLSTPGGLSLVQKCSKRGFHTHPPTDTGQELYELCGHVYLNPRVKHETIDLR